jgi:DoxX-like family
MSESQITAPTSKGMMWADWVLSLLPVPLLLMGAIMSFHMSADAQANFKKMGWEPGAATTIGVLSLTSVVLYLVPQTAVLGAILLTGYLGGAVATHLRVGESVEAWIPVAFGVVIWLGLLLRDARVRSLLPIRKL